MRERRMGLGLGLVRCEGDVFMLRRVSCGWMDGMVAERGRREMDGDGTGEEK